EDSVRRDQLTVVISRDRHILLLPVAGFFHLRISAIDVVFQVVVDIDNGACTADIGRFGTAPFVPQGRIDRSGTPSLAKGECTGLPVVRTESEMQQILIGVS